MQQSTLIDYKPLKSRPGWIAIAGILSVALCCLQYAWGPLVGLAWWMFITGDNLQTPAQRFTMLLVAGLPALSAVALGLLAVIRSPLRADRVAGVIGIAGGIAWLVWLVRHSP